MPGIRFAYVTIGDSPQLGAGLLANSLSGTGTPPAANLRGGDVVAQTTAAALTAAGAAVIRMLLAADKAAAYKEGTPVAGIMGVAAWDANTSNLGQIQGSVNAPGVNTGAGAILNFPSISSGMPVDPNTARSRVDYYTASEMNVFLGKLDATSAAATPARNNTLAGLILTTSGGVTTYTIDTGAAAAAQCLRILRCNEQDPLYGSVGGEVFFQFLPAFDQAQTGVNYSTQ